MRVDAHIHILPPDYRAELERRSLAPPLFPPWSAGMVEDLMQRYAIDASVLSLAPPGVWFGDQGLANELARLVNERTAELVRSAPHRYAGLAYLPLPDVGAAIDELDHAFDELKLDGVALTSNIDGVYHGDPDWAPLWDELERRGAYVFLHPAAPPYATPLPHHPIWQYEFPFDTTRAVVNLIYSGTLERAPRVRLQVAHLGGVAPFIAERIASLEVREPDKAREASGGALTALSRLFYDTGLSNSEIPVRTAIATASIDQIVFGTDWPYAALPATGDPAPELDFLGGDRVKVDSGNAGKLVPRFASPRQVGQA